jgi:hypothetical protein
MTEEEYERVAAQVLGVRSHLATAGAVTVLANSPNGIHSASADPVPARGDGDGVVAPSAADVGEEVGEVEAVEEPRPAQRRKTARTLRRALSNGQIDQGQYLRRLHLAGRATSVQQLADLVSDLEAEPRLRRQGIVSLVGGVSLSVTVLLLVANFVLLAFDVHPGLGMVVPTAGFWGLSVLSACVWLPANRHRGDVLAGPS